jgi:hypothetical protein
MPSSTQEKMQQALSKLQEGMPLVQQDILGVAGSGLIINQNTHAQPEISRIAAGLSSPNSTSNGWRRP